MMNRGNGVTGGDYTLRSEFVKYSFTVRRTKQNLDGVADTLHHISHCLREDYGRQLRAQRGVSQPDPAITELVRVGGRASATV